MDAFDDSDNHTSHDEQPINISSSSTAANKSKLVVTSQAPEEEMDISFTEEDQPAPQLHITNVDQPKTDTNQITQPIPSSSSSNPPVLEKSSPPQSNTQEKGKSLERKDKQSDIYGKDEANYIVTGFQPSPMSKAVHDILIYDIPAKWSNFDILQHLSSWGRVISLQVKRQNKYKTVCCKFEMNELFLKYDTNKSWIAPLNALPVRWFLASWSLKERKERKRY
ncbi:hypothetical protein RclHR1_20260001 [Rhizophagus clarus]|uniref:RRM domain-containing protein n=1 Tax=Rhizophagus clarus TaxID=94130 RepID=A0A2Z6QVM9_9GLOM|nr:hypothetical protein RclHR1_20260001 [Rhizophagus clarus]GES97674.1 hypothetical protein GLOIN_2v1774577 [Rhizophagus clarus]